MSTRNIVVLAIGLVAVGIALTLIFGRQTEAAERGHNPSQERRLEAENCLEPVKKLFWRLTPIA